MELQWPDNYPSRDVLRGEVHAMVNAWVTVLQSHIPGDEIRGIYFKGSGHKQWDSLVDYVPELSDVDIHISFQDEKTSSRYIGDIRTAARIQAEVSEAYLRAVPEPVHLPRPQVIVLNELEQDPDYVPSPPAIVETLVGEPYPRGDYPDAEALRRTDMKRLLESKAEAERIPYRLFDKPGKYLPPLLRSLSWHVSPLASRVLSVLGVEFEEAWSVNRTDALQRLSAMGQSELVENCCEWYQKGWRIFLDGEDDCLVREALLAGVRAIQAGAKVGEG